MNTMDKSSVTKQRHYDAVIIGGGHNGLVCAAYLAHSGLSVLALERQDHVGGAVELGRIDRLLQQYEADIENDEPGFFQDFARQRGFLRLSVFDLSARAVAYDLPIPFGDLYGFENDGRVAHPANMSLRRAHSSRIAGEKKK